MPKEAQPYRLQLNFTTAHTQPEAIAGLLDAVNVDATNRGLIPEWSVALEMDREDVLPGSELEKLVLGKDDEDYSVDI